MNIKYWNLPKSFKKYTKCLWENIFEDPHRYTTINDTWIIYKMHDVANQMFHVYLEMKKRRRDKEDGNKGFKFCKFMILILSHCSILVFSSWFLISSHHLLSLKFNSSSNFSHSHLSSFYVYTYSLTMYIIQKTISLLITSITMFIQIARVNWMLVVLTHFINIISFYNFSIIQFYSKMT